MNIKLTFGPVSQGEEPSTCVCGVLDAEKTVCGTETQEDRIANIVEVKLTKEKVNCHICLSIIRICKQFKASELQPG